LRVFTTRPDTLFGATFMVLAPEHPLVATLTAPERRAEVGAYVAAAAAKTEIDRLSTDREKTGMAIGADAINPVNGERIPIFVADYVLGGYGTGAIMAVPAHDERDYGFAVTFGLPIRRVVARPGEEATDVAEAYVAHSDDEVLVNSGPFSGLSADEGGRRIIADLEGRGLGRTAVTYRLRDWLISRQRYWGTPIPIIYCETHGTVPVPEEDLPVRLPDTVDYAGSGVNPLTRDEAFLNVPCPIGGEPARRETDTMDTFVDSSWYWYRYLSPHRADAPFDPDLVEGWTPVEQYTGGAEHAVMHLLYAREWTKMMRDIGLVQQNEPWRRVFNQGQILGADGERMSKSRGNTVDPDDLVARYGADTVRLFLMFMGPWDQGGPWTTTGIEGVHRFLRRVWALVLDAQGRDRRDGADGLPAGEDAAASNRAIRAAAHKTLRDVTTDYESFHFNTMIAKLMELSNTLYRYRGTPVAGGEAWDEAIRLLLLMLAPAAPHITEELWSRRQAAAGEAWSSIHTASWPDVDPAAVAETTREVPVQVNGKLRDRVEVPVGISAADLEALVLARDKVRAALAGRAPDRVIQAGGGKLVNIVLR
jgi:leucyl-tRNA synthetase